MVESQLRAMALSLRGGKDQLAKGRELLIEEYGKARAPADFPVRAMAGYELAKSMVLQSLYEEGAGQWLAAGDIAAERADAEEELAWYRSDGMEGALRRAGLSLDDPENMERAMLDMESSGIVRFIGSVRACVPGLGYAISVRKRDTMNQDSFIIEGGSPALFAVADGCSGSAFPAMASHLAVRSLSRMRAGLLSDPRGTICAISSRISSLLADDRMRAALGVSDGGCTTLTACLPGAGKAYKVGDSLPFRANLGGPTGVECISAQHSLVAVVGTGLAPDAVEELDAGGGQVVLTTDGITNYLPDFAARLARLMDITTDPVMIAENVIRAVLRNQAEWGHADDATIIVQDDGMIR